MQAYIRDLYAQPLADTLELDRFKDGYSAGPAWEELPACWYDEVQFSGAGPTGFQHNEEFHFAESTRGAVSFVVDAPPQQLAIDLASQFSDALGYIIIVGDQGFPSTVLSQRTGLGPLANVRDVRPPGFRFQNTGNTLWVIYDYGSITVGTGRTPGQGIVLLRARDPQAMPNQCYVGFGAWRNDDNALTAVRHIRFYRPRQRQPQLQQHPYAAHRTLY